MSTKSRSLHDIADEVATYLDSQDGHGHDVSNEPRVPKGNGKQSGEWTRGQSNPNSEAPATAKASVHGRTVTIIRSDGTVEIRSGGSHAWRDNNPGNIKAGDRAHSMGAIGHDGRFAIFPDEATGTAAQETLLLNVYSGKTIDKTIEAWAPEKDGNDTARYKAFVRHVTGLDGNRKIGELTSDERHRLMDAQRSMEGWKPGTVSGA